MKIVYEKPPIWDEANKHFKLQKGVVFTYGDTIYNPDGAIITPDLLIHEQTHSKQQEYNNTVAHIWWLKFFEDPQFRLEQEVSAYAAQYRYICAKVKDPNARDRNLRELGRQLSGPIYGNIITHYAAMQAIKAGRLDTVKEV